MGRVRVRRSVRRRVAGRTGGASSASDPDGPLDTNRQVRSRAESLDVDDIVEELDDEFSGEAEAKRFDEALGIDPEIFDSVKERLDELKEEIRSGRNPGELLQEWLRKRKQ